MTLEAELSAKQCVYSVDLEADLQAGRSMDDTGDTHVVSPSDAAASAILVQTFNEQLDPLTGGQICHYSLDRQAVLQF
jgi:hypothetical protein